MEAVHATLWDGAGAQAWQAAWNAPAVHLLARVGSTNDVARRLAEEGAAAGTVVVADVQGSGRGREGRSWHAPPGRALLLSVILRPPGPPATALPLRVGLAAARGLERETGVPVGVKWPNDLVAGGRKLGGILCEGSIGGAATFVIAGIGVNVLQEQAELEPSIRDSATSLRLLGRPASRGRLAGAILDELRRARTAPHLSDDELAELAARDVLLGREITVDGEPAGTAAGIAPDGALRVRRDGALRLLRTGTVRAVAATSAKGSA
jgi:BirA family transcriptional regulator, biotin operon repressor / biotin---[acetyl-CoA-carboxylase] ligase